MVKNQTRPALSAFLLMLTMSLLTTALSFFVAPVCEDLGFGRGSFTLYYSLMVAAGYTLMSLHTGIYAALVFLAIGSGSIGTLMPIVVRRIFGGLHYAAIWSVVITCSSVASFLASPTWGMVYDFTGSYRPALLAMPVFLAFGMVCLLGAFKNVED